MASSSNCISRRPPPRRVCKLPSHRPSLQSRRPGPAANQGQSNRRAAQKHLHTRAGPAAHGIPLGGLCYGTGRMVGSDQRAGKPEDDRTRGRLRAAAELSISLVAEDGAVLAQAQTILAIRLAPAQPPPAKEVQAERPKGPPPATARAPILSPADRETAERFIAPGENAKANRATWPWRASSTCAPRRWAWRAAALLAGRHLRPARAGAIWCAGRATELGRSAEMV